MSRCFDRDIVVIGEVDAGMSLIGVVCDSEKLTLNLEILGTWNVLSVTPLTVSRATWRGRIAASTAVRATSSCRITVGVRVEGSRATLRWPAIAGGNRIVTAWLEVRCTSPFAAITMYRPYEKLAFNTKRKQMKLQHIRRGKEILVRTLRYPKRFRPSPFQIHEVHRPSLQVVLQVVLQLGCACVEECKRSEQACR